MSGATVYRLIDGHKPYKLEVRPTMDLAAASTLATKWWAEPATIAVVVLEGQREDARYERQGFKVADVPYLWPLRKATLAEQDRGAPVPVPAAQEPAAEGTAPTLANDDKPLESVRVLTEAVIAAVKEGMEARELRCPCCMRAWCDQHDGDSDPTPSGRINAFRCAHCGAPADGMTRRQLNDQYMAMQQAASEHQRKKFKPRTGAW